MHNIQQSLADFNEAVAIRLPAITPPLFRSTVEMCIGCIEQALGSDAPEVIALKRAPPIPIQDRSEWNSKFGLFESSTKPNEYQPIQLRPDLVFYPVVMMAVMVHEAAHSRDPKLVEATRFAAVFNEIDEDHPQYGEFTLEWSKRENRVEHHAISREIEMLRKVQAPQSLTAEQRDYVAFHRQSLHAARCDQLSKTDGAAVIIELATMIWHRVATAPALANTDIVPVGQKLLTSAVSTDRKSLTWGTEMISSVRNLQRLFERHCEASTVQTIPFDAFCHRLEDCQRISDQHAFLASKVLLPPVLVV